MGHRGQAEPQVPQGRQQHDSPASRPAGQHEPAGLAARRAAANSGQQRWRRPAGAGPRLGPDRATGTPHRPRYQAAASVGSDEHTAVQASATAGIGPAPAPPAPAPRWRAPPSPGSSGGLRVFVAFSGQARPPSRPAGGTSRTRPGPSIQTQGRHRRTGPRSRPSPSPTSECPGLQHDEAVPGPLALFAGQSRSPRSVVTMTGARRRPAALRELEQSARSRSPPGSSRASASSTRARRDAAGRAAAPRPVPRGRARPRPPGRSSPRRGSPRRGSPTRASRPAPSRRARPGGRRARSGPGERRALELADDQLAVPRRRAQCTRRSGSPRR